MPVAISWVDLVLWWRRKPPCLVVRNAAGANSPPKSEPSWSRSVVRTPCPPATSRGRKPCWRWPPSTAIRLPLTKPVGDAVALRVARFNREGMAAIFPRQGGGHPARYTVADRERILAEARRAPDRERDGTAVWSLRTLRRALRRSGLPQISTATIRQVLRGAGLTWQKQRSWCETGTAQRRRRRAGRAAVVTVTDPDAEAKKTDRAGLPGWGTAGVDGVVRG